MASISAYRTKSGDTSWRVKWREGGSRSGKSQTFTFYTLDEAERFKSLVDACGNRTPSDHQLKSFDFGHLFYPQEGQVSSDAVPTFEQVAEAYLAGLDVQKDTLHEYRRYLRMHVIPHLGKVPIDQITKRDLREWQELLLSSGSSPKTIRNIRGSVVAPVFELACSEGEEGEPPLRLSNPMRGLKVPRVLKRRREILESVEEFHIVRDAAREVDPYFAELVMAMLTTGCRWQEIAAVPCRAVSVSRGTFDIVQVWWRDRADRTWRLKPHAKSAEGNREVPLVPAMVVILEERLRGREGDNPAFADRYGHWWSYGRSYHRWARTMDLASQMGLTKRLRMHDCRHNYTTLLLEAGVDVATVRNVVGHADLTTTNRYTQRTTRHHGKVVEALEGFFGSD